MDSLTLAIAGTITSPDARIDAEGELRYPADKSRSSIHNAPIDSIVGRLEDSKGEVVLGVIFFGDELLFEDQEQTDINSDSFS